VDQAAAQTLLEPLLRTPTAPYCEDAVAELIIRTLDDLGIEHRTDGFGNIVARRPGEDPDGPLIGFMAHMDHPGFQVTEMQNNGVEAAWYGGVSPDYFAGAHVVFYAGSEEFRGIIVSASGDDTIPTKTVRVMCDRLPPVGALGMWDLPDPDFSNGIVRGAAIDDVAGCGLLLAALTELPDRGVDAEVWAIFTRAEEVGFVGAIGLANSGELPLTLPIVSVEMSSAMPGATQGLGPVVRLGDKSGVFDDSFLRFMRETAAQLKAEDTGAGFRYQQALMEGGSCEAPVLNAFGYRTAGLALPLGNYHNELPPGGGTSRIIAREEIGLNDFLNAVFLMVEMCARFPGMDSVINQQRKRLVDSAKPRISQLRRALQGGGRI